MMFTDEQKQEILNDALEGAKQEIVKSAVSNLSYNIEWAVKNEVSTIVNEWATEELKPALRDKLSSEKGQIIESAMQAGEEIAITLTKSLVEKAGENLASGSYKRKKIFEALFE